MTECNNLDDECACIILMVHVVGVVPFGFYWSALDTWPLDCG